jgi:GNAT superfamily N-acetyltransferase
MSAVEIRTPEPVDAEALGRCHLACWREAYGDLVDPARLAPFLADVEGFVSRWRDFLDGAWPVRVAEDANGLVGFASVRPAVDDVPAHLNALYVRRERWSTGLGQRLLDAVLGDQPATRRCSGTTRAHGASTPATASCPGHPGTRPFARNRRRHPKRDTPRTCARRRRS